MTNGGPILRFDDFTLDQSAAELRKHGIPVPLKARYFDTLSLLVRNPGELITKDRFFDQVWAGVTVGDESLTQAIKEVRKALGEDGTAPRLIQTVPRRGYRFIGDVVDADKAPAQPRRLDLVLAGTIGGAIAGLIGGTAYGLLAGSGNPAALVILLVMMTITTAVAALGALGLTVGMAIASRLAAKRWLFSPVGAGLGGFVVGEAFHRLASGGFSLFVGARHEAFTGGFEGLILGTGIAIGAHLVDRGPLSARRVGLGGAAGGCIAGVMIGVLGGRLMAASLAALARRFHGSELDLGLFGRFVAEQGQPTLLTVVVSGAEGLLLGGCLAGAIAYRLRTAQPEITL